MFNRQKLLQRTGLYDYLVKNKPCSGNGMCRQSSTSVQKELRTKPYSAIPSPLKLPFVGHLHLFSKFGPYSFQKLYEAYADLYKKYGPVIRLDVGLKMVLLFDPVSIQKLFYLGDRYPQRPLFQALRKYRLQKKDIYSCGGLVSENGEEWWRLRKAVNFMMVPTFVQSYFLPQEEIANEFIFRMQKIRESNGLIPDFLQELYKYTEEAIGLICFGKRLGLLDTPSDFSSQLTEAAEDTLQALADTLLGFPWWKFYPTSTYKKLVRSQDFFQSFAAKCVEEAENKLKFSHDKDIKELEFLKHLFDNETLERKDIILLMTELFSAGIDATGNSIGFLLYNLSQNPDCQENLYQDIKTHSSASGFSAESVSKMKYLKACIQESNRLTPVSGGIARILSSSTVLHGYAIPENVLCIGLNPVISRQENHFKNAMAFQPERWLNESHTQYVTRSHPYCVLPFSHGVRRCVGQRFAEQEIRLCIIKIVEKYQVKYDGPEIGTKMRMSLVPDKPLNFKFLER